MHLGRDGARAVDSSHAHCGCRMRQGRLALGDGAPLVEVVVVEQHLLRVVLVVVVVMGSIERETCRG